MALSISTERGNCYLHYGIMFISCVIIPVTRFVFRTKSDAPRSMFLKTSPYQYRNSQFKDYTGLSVYGKPIPGKTVFILWWGSSWNGRQNLQVQYLYRNTYVAASYWNTPLVPLINSHLFQFLQSISDFMPWENHYLCAILMQWLHYKCSIGNEQYMIYK